MSWLKALAPYSGVAGKAILEQLDEWNEMNNAWQENMKAENDASTAEYVKKMYPKIYGREATEEDIQQEIANRQMAMDMAMMSPAIGATRASKLFGRVRGTALNDAAKRIGAAAEENYFPAAFMKRRVEQYRKHAKDRLNWDQEDKEKFMSDTKHALNYVKQNEAEGNYKKVTEEVLKTLKDRVDDTILSPDTMEEAIAQLYTDRRIKTPTESIDANRARSATLRNKRLGEMYYKKLAQGKIPEGVGIDEFLAKYNKKPMTPMSEEQKMSNLFEKLKDYKPPADLDTPSFSEREMNELNHYRKLFDVGPIIDPRVSSDRLRKHSAESSARTAKRDLEKFIKYNTPDSDQLGRIQGEYDFLTNESSRPRPPEQALEEAKQRLGTTLRTDLKHRNKHFWRYADESLEKSWEKEFPQLTRRPVSSKEELRKNYMDELLKKYADQPAPAEDLVPTSGRKQSLADAYSSMIKTSEGRKAMEAAMHKAWDKKATIHAPRTTPMGDYYDDIMNTAPSQDFLKRLELDAAKKKLEMYGIDPVLSEGLKDIANTSDRNKKLLELYEEALQAEREGRVPSFVTPQRFPTDPVITKWATKGKDLKQLRSKNIKPLWETDEIMSELFPKKGGKK